MRTAIVLAFGYIMTMLIIVMVAYVSCSKFPEDPDIVSAQLSSPPPPVVTSSNPDEVFTLMVNGLKPGKQAQWQEVHLIGYSVVRIDKVLSQTELAAIDWTDIYNQLKILSYAKVKTHNITIPAVQALDPSRTLSGGWTTSIITRSTETIAVAYRPLGSFYEVSFVKFLKWK